MATKRKSARKGAKRSKRGSGKRDLITPRGDKRYVRRTAKGKFTDSQDDVGRSLSRDVRKKAKRTTKAGHGDEGDRRRGSSARRKRSSGGAKRKSGRKRATARK